MSLPLDLNQVITDFRTTLPIQAALGFCLLRAVVSGWTGLTATPTIATETSGDHDERRWCRTEILLRPLARMVAAGALAFAVKPVAAPMVAALVSAITDLQLWRDPASLADPAARLHLALLVTVAGAALLLGTGFWLSRWIGDLAVAGLQRLGLPVGAAPAR